jgi:membrane-bound serine protease (ClpP class)
MRRVLLISLALAAVAWPLVPAHAADNVHITDVVKIEGIIDGRVANLIEDRLAAADPDGLVILQINSPGTLGADPSSLAFRISRSETPVVVWVGPSGSLIQGGAVLLMTAAHVAVTSPRSGIGPGLPVDLGNQPWPCATGNQKPPPGAPSNRPAGGDCAQTYAAALAAGNAEERGRNVAAAKALFQPGAQPLTPQESLDRGVADEVAQSIPELLRNLDGRGIETFGGTRNLVTEGGPEAFALRFSELGPIDRVLHAVSSPSASYVLLVLALWAIAFELVQPGFGLAGFTGILFAALAVYSFTVLPVSWLGLGLIVAGALLYVLDVRLRNLGLFTILGTAAFAVGSFLIYGKVSDRIDVAPWVIWTFIVGSVVYFGFVLTVAVRSRERAIAQHQSGLVGLIGEAASDLSPEGQVVVKGAMWQGRALGDPIPGGAKVRVRNVEGLVLEVTAEAGAEAEPKT